MRKILKLATDPVTLAYRIIQSDDDFANYAFNIFWQMILPDPQETQLSIRLARLNSSMLKISAQ